MYPKSSSQIISWTAKGGYAIIDQGIVSGATFAINIFLARLLTPNGYGTFAITFSIFMFIALFQNALILEPMSVIGPTRHYKHLQKYYISLVFIQIGVSFLFTGIFVFSSVLLYNGENSFSKPLLGLAVAVPFTMFFWLLRRTFYVELKPKLALNGSIIYALTIFLGLITIWKWNSISPFNTFIIMALASAAASSYLFPKLGLRLKDLSLSSTSFGVKSVINQHWRYGKWVVGTNLIGWISVSLYLPLIGYYSSLEAVGAFRAIQNLFFPLGQTLSILSVLLLPWITRQISLNIVNFPKSITLILVVLMSSLTTFYIIILVLFDEIAIKMLYGDGYYISFAWVMPYIGMVYFIRSIADSSIGVVLRALENSKAIFLAGLGSGFTTLTLGILLVYQFSIKGAVIGMIASSIIQLLIMISRFRRSLD